MDENSTQTSDSGSCSVSIVMPVYNAEKFLQAGLDCIAAQTFTDWELIAVDDESSDESKRLIENFASAVEQRVVYKWQENKGGFGARNTGIDLATGKYIAFFDCDDLWNRDHLQRSVSQLEMHADVDWVFAANRIVNIISDEVLQKSNFYEPDGSPRPLLQLSTESRGPLEVITDNRAAAFQLRYGLNVGQQFSVIRSEVFDGYRFRAGYRNEGADQISVVRSLKKGFQFAYLNEIHGTYAVHDNNASAGCKNAEPAKYLRLRTALIRGFEELAAEVTFNAREKEALRRRIAKERFWDIGYNILYMNGETEEALAQFKEGLGQWPWDYRMWKTFIGANLRRLRSGRVAE